jgi:hypothetical protein
MINKKIENKVESKDSSPKKLKESTIKPHEEKEFNSFIAQSLKSGGSHIVANKSHGKTRLMFAIAERLQKDPNIRNIVFDGSETWIYSASKIPVLTIGDHMILRANRSTTEEIEKYQLQSENLVKLALKKNKDLLFRLKSRSPSKRGFLIRYVVNYLDALQREEKSRNSRHEIKQAIAFYIEEAQDAFNNRATASNEAEEFLCVFNEARNQHESFFTASQRLNDFSKTIRSKQKLCIGSLSMEDLTPSLRRLEKEFKLDFSNMKAKKWFYEGLTFESPIFRQHGKPYQINKQLKTPETPEQKEERILTLSEKVLKWLNPQAYFNQQIKKLAKAQKLKKATKGKTIKENYEESENLSLEELEELESTDSLSEEQKDQLSEERDLNEIQEELL